MPVSKKEKAKSFYIGSLIDDYGFSPEEFRLLCRTRRRDGEDGCYESIPNLAISLGMSQHLVRRSLNVLVACNAISREVRLGQSDLFHFNLYDQWQPKEMLATIRSSFDAGPKRKDRDRKKGLVVSETIGVGNDRGTPIGNGRGVVSEMIDKGISPQSSPIKDTKTASRDADIRAVFEEWQSVLNHPNAIYDQKRKRIIKARLEEGFTVEDLKAVPHGVKQSAYHLGDNPGRVRYDGIETIYQSAAHVEKFMALAAQSESSESKVADFSHCMDCRGFGLKHLPNGKGMTKCKHEASKAEAAV